MPRGGAFLPVCNAPGRAASAHTGGRDLSVARWGPFTLGSVTGSLGGGATAERSPPAAHAPSAVAPPPSCRRRPPPQWPRPSRGPGRHLLRRPPVLKTPASLSPGMAALAPQAPHVHRRVSLPGRPPRPPRPPVASFPGRRLQATGRSSPRHLAGWSRKEFPALGLKPSERPGWRQPRAEGRKGAPSH